MQRRHIFTHLQNASLFSKVRLLCSGIALLLWLFATPILAQDIDTPNTEAPSAESAHASEQAATSPDTAEHNSLAFHADSTLGVANTTSSAPTVPAALALLTMLAATDVVARTGNRSRVAPASTPAQPEADQPSRPTKTPFQQLIAATPIHSRDVPTTAPAYEVPVTPFQGVQTLHIDGQPYELEIVAGQALQTGNMFFTLHNPSGAPLPTTPIEQLTMHAGSRSWNMPHSDQVQIGNSAYRVQTQVYESDPQYASAELIPIAETAVEQEGRDYPEADATGEVTIERSSQLASLVYDGYNEGELGPVSIIPGVLDPGDVSPTEDVYVVTLSGTEFVKGQPTGIINDILAGTIDTSFYATEVRDVIREQIPPGSTIILAGHSLGGMVAQSLAGFPTLKEEYDIRNTVAFGSPHIEFTPHEGEVQRLADSTDPVPFLSLDGLFQPFEQIFGREVEDSEYFFIDAHSRSYTDADVWEDYDAVGIEDGAATIRYNPADRTFHRVYNPWASEDD
ncbi:MAG: hypothetical protein AAGF95_34265 [Chloroflexota bacterium]